ncbi:hypothetical protein [Actinoplanes subglobosus]|uniref:HTH cro/C1-type domain-containing protein n=1 Tax=Actinoplanes subglobosus TaxID=1547892 RepID=A0ABV8IUR3_9ACTN
MFRFFPNSPAVAVGMARHGLSTLADLAEYIGADVLDVAEWQSGQHTYRAITEGMAALCGMLGISVFHVMYVPDDDEYPSVSWEDLEDLEAFHESLNL